LRQENQRLKQLVAVFVFRVAIPLATIRLAKINPCLEVP
jgi:hypothetical protein